MKSSTLPSTESMDALFAEQPDLDRLLWVLQRAKGFALYFARCNTFQRIETSWFRLCAPS
jgi:hypothetical protein